MTGGPEVERVHTEVRDGIAFVELRHPPHNQLRFDDYRSLATFWREMAHEDLVGAILSAAPGSRSFSSGNDLDALLGSSVDSMLDGAGDLRDCLAAMRQLDAPVICVMDGLAAGSACSLAAACDIRIGTAHASISLPEIRFGGVGGGSWLLDELSPQLVRYMVMSGRPVPAERLLAAGWFAEVLPDAGQAMTFARELLDMVGGFPRNSVAMAKYSLRALVDAGLSTERGFELETRLLARAVLGNGLIEMGGPRD